MATGTVMDTDEVTILILTTAMDKVTITGAMDMGMGWVTDTDTDTGKDIITTPPTTTTPITRDTIMADTGTGMGMATDGRSGTMDKAVP
jgi:hypothetical protein